MLFTRFVITRNILLSDFTTTALVMVFSTSGSKVLAIKSSKLSALRASPAANCKEHHTLQYEYSVLLKSIVLECIVK